LRLLQAIGLMFRIHSKRVVEVALLLRLDERRPET